MKSAGIIGLGKYLPKKVVTNNDLVLMGLDTTDEWIKDRSGIEERRISDASESSSDLAYEAGKNAIADAGLKPEDIDLLIVATTTPDYQVFPSTAAILQARLGLRQVGAFDLSAACTGFSYALTTATQFVKTGFAKNVLVIGVDTLSKYVNWQDRSICILFGDGAGAAVVSEVKYDYGVLSSNLYADGKHAETLIVRAGGSRTPISEELLRQQQNYIYMNGKAVFKLAVNCVVPSILDALEKTNLTPSDLDFFVPHQANIRIIEAARERLGLKPEQVYVNLQKYGNTSSASIPIALTEAKEEKLLKDGQILALSGFGAGFTWATNIIRWGGLL
ncbi:MAG: beta-ketoacyl-ACP synthase III [Candidatus Margulisiibacteriota bacterium]|jgi:3-oxoacyl-[acyl-carrier-protein] synthase-3